MSKKPTTDIHDENGSYERIIELMTNDEALIAELKSCAENPKKYFSENAERYEERWFEGNESDDKIIWIGIADAMISAGEAVELDWKAELEEFLWNVRELSDKHSLELRDEWFEENDDIPKWCKLLDDRWRERDFCIAAMDIDSDSYVMFVCRTDMQASLAAFSKELGHRFDFAKNM